MKDILKRIHSLPPQTHKAISFLSILGAAVIGWIFAQFDVDFAMILCLIVMIGGIVWYIAFVRCPHCGSMLNWRAVVPNFCPECGKKLE